MPSGGHHTPWATLRLSTPSLCKEESPGSWDVSPALLLTGLRVSHPKTQGFGLMRDVWAQKSVVSRGPAVRGASDSTRVPFHLRVFLLPVCLYLGFRVTL